MMRDKETGLSFARENSSVRGRRDAVRFGHVRVTISDRTPLLPSYGVVTLARQSGPWACYHPLARWRAEPQASTSPDPRALDNRRERSRCASADSSPNIPDKRDSPDRKQRSFAVDCRAR